MANDDEKNLPSVRRASELDVSFPDIPKTLTQREGRKIQKAIIDGGVEYGQKTYLSEGAVQDLLGTDVKGTQIVFNNAPEDDIKSYGGTEFLYSPEVQKEIAKRIEQPRKALERERLRYSSDCVEALSECPQLEKERTIQSDRIGLGRKGMTQKALNERKPECSELTGEPFDDTPMGRPVGHHKDRVAEHPEKALDTDNIAVIRTGEHVDFHNSDYLPTSDGFEQAKQDHKRRKKR